MTAEHLFAGLAIASLAGLVLLIVWCEWPRKPRPTYRATVPASRWPPHSEP
ncbi:MAG TPA: hypothetical protein VGU03_10925 [Frateuria sp.]|uniref:hypothetical protein n=1 Tax=Frateuria sp. TaxID=2211372 RepID=UPI002DF514D0|nr:hypothetical protein [Frateuria sp.]